MDDKDHAVIMEEMRKLVYEKYNCHIQNVQVVLSDAENWRKDIEKLDTERHILCPFEFMIDIGRSIVPQDPHFSRLFSLVMVLSLCDQSDRGLRRIPQNNKTELWPSLHLIV